MKDMYLINMHGLKEFYCMLVEKDIWDWFSYSGKNPCPTRLIDNMWKQLGDEHDSKSDMINYYKECPPDERAVYATEICPMFDTVSEMMQFVKKEKIKIIDEETFAIY